MKTQVDGRIDKVLFNEGQHVKKGDVLVQIDPRPFAIQLQTAQAALARDTAKLKNAQLNLERYKTLREQNLIAAAAVHRPGGDGRAARRAGAGRPGADRHRAA